MVIAVVLLGLKPVIYHLLLRGVSETPKLAWNLGFRLGQCSEFALLVGVALEAGHLTTGANTLIQAITILTLLASSYIVVTVSPPIAIDDDLRRD